MSFTRCCRIVLLLHSIVCHPNLTEGQKIESELLQYLQTYRCGPPISVYPCSFLDNVNMTERVKNRMIDLLRNRWTDEELAPIIELKFTEDFEYLYFERILDSSTINARKIFFSQFGVIFSRSRIDKNATLSGSYKKIYDSVYSSQYSLQANAYRNTLAKQIRAQTVPDDLVKLAAQMNLQDVVSLLKSDLQAKEHHLYNPEVAELALAKLGDTNLYRKILNECRYDSSLIDIDTIRQITTDAWTNDFLKKFEKLSFLKTQESLFQLHQWLDTSKITVVLETSNGVRHYGYAPYQIMYKIFFLLGRGDLFKEYRSRSLDKSPETAAAILSFRKWMIENKGKYNLVQKCPE